MSVLRAVFSFFYPENGLPIYQSIRASYHRSLESSSVIDVSSIKYEIASHTHTKHRLKLSDHIKHYGY
jgi:hypothetical protein